MSYRNDVAEARRLMKQSEADQWRLAELTFRVVESGVTRTKWASDVGCSGTHVSYLYRVHDEYAGSKISFTDAYAKVRSGDANATRASIRGDSSVKDASPAAIVKAVTERADVVRALARNDAAREAIEDAAIEHRARHRDDVPSNGTAEKVGRNVGRALGLDEVVDHLRTAAREIGKAAIAAEELPYDGDAADAAIRAIKRALKAFSGETLSDTDREFLAEIGVRA